MLKKKQINDILGFYQNNFKERDKFMEVLGHVLTFYAALRQAGISKEQAESFVVEHAAKVCLTDSIRCTVTGDNVVKYGRGYSHFSDGCYMVLPCGKALKTYTNIHQTTFDSDKNYKSKFSDTPTDFCLFIKTNPHLFTPENSDWGLSVLSHLQQDVNTDYLWLHNLCKCNVKNNQVLYINSDIVVTGETFRKDMALVNIYIHRVFIELIFDMFGDYILDDFLELPKNSFRKWYNPAMAENTCKCITTDPRVFKTPSRKLYNELNITKTGLFENCGQLEEYAYELFNNSMVCFNAFLNKIAR